jgi:hypothetical protein
MPNGKNYKIHDIGWVLNKKELYTNTVDKINDPFIII